MIIEAQVMQRTLKRKELLINSVKIMLVLTVYWAVLLYLMLSSESISISRLGMAANAFKLFFGMTLGVFALVYARWSKDRHLMLGLSLAVLSWTLGQLYWFSYLYLVGMTTPYPSIADLGFIGAYYFFIGVICTITGRIPQYTIKLKYRNLWPLALLLVPIFLALVGKNSLQVDINNLALTLALIITLWKAQPILPSSRYRIFLSGVCLMCLCEIVFMVSIVLFHSLYTFATDAIYPIALSLSVYGFMKAEEMPDG